MFRNLNILLRTLVLAGLVGLGGWWTLFLRERFSDHRQALQVANDEIADLASNLEASSLRIAEQGEAIVELNTELDQKSRELEELGIAMALLKVDHRIARIEVLDQGPSDDDPELVQTRVRFVELDVEGQPLSKPIEATIDGTTLYVESGDALRGTSVCLFRRLFGEAESPSAGVDIDPAGLQPLAYTGVEGPSALHRELWSRFWEYANDPELARERGVKAIHGEAPFIETRLGKSYRVELRSSGGLTIQAEE